MGATGVGTADKQLTKELTKGELTWAVYPYVVRYQLLWEKFEIQQVQPLHRSGRLEPCVEVGGKGKSGALFSKPETPEQHSYKN